jgi:hypothetical protein
MKHAQNVFFWLGAIVPYHDCIETPSRCCAVVIGIWIDARDWRHRDGEYVRAAGQGE